MFQKSEEINAFGFHGEFTKDDANTAFWITLVSVVLQILSSAKGGHKVSQGRERRRLAEEAAATSSALYPDPNAEYSKLLA